jgi:hypothetical protein
VGGPLRSTPPGFQQHLHELPTFTREQIEPVREGSLSLDAETRRYIRERLGYRYTVTADSRTALTVESQIQLKG